MIVTFLVPVNLSDLSDLPSIALDLEDDLRAAGHDISEGTVHPWARPNLPLASPAGGFTSLTAPVNQPPILPIL